MIDSVYPKQGYFIDIHHTRGTVKIFRAIHIDSVSQKNDMIGMVYSLIRDDIFNQSLEMLQEEFTPLYTFTTQMREFEIFYNDLYEKYPNEKLSRSISPHRNSSKWIEFHYDYQSALVSLYKHLSKSEKIKEHSIQKNGIDYTFFVKYIERCKELYPEDFI